jgi:hypothetical protein
MAECLVFISELQGADRYNPVLYRQDGLNCFRELQKRIEKSIKRMTPNYCSTIIADVSLHYDKESVSH